MVQYIDKADVVAEIERIIKGLERQNPDELGTTIQCMAAAEIEALNLVKDFLNTIEVKEVDLEKILKNYPERIYEVQSNGVMTLYLKTDVKYLKTKPNLDLGEPYEPILMLEKPSDDIGWRLRDYESFIKDKNRQIWYTQLSLNYINKQLNAESIEIWTLDIDEAKRISQERYSKCFPTGNAYDVVQYWNDCDRKVIKSQLLRSEAHKLCTDLNNARKIGSLYSYSVEVVT